MSISSYGQVECTFPKGTELHEDEFTTEIGECDGKPYIFEEFDGYHSDTILEEYVRLFGKPLDEVEGLDLHLYYECFEDGFWKMELDIKDGKCHFEESEIVMHERPMSECPVDIMIGTRKGQVRDARLVWERLSDVPVDDDGRILDVFYAYDELGRTYNVGTDREDIWHDIEDRLDVSVAWLMGLAKNPDGTNE
jgi:hypothetical protein